MDSLSNPDFNASVFSFVISLVTATAWAGFLYVLPGYALSQLLLRPPLLTKKPNRLDLLHTVALSAALTISLYPILFLWTNRFAYQVGVWIAWVPGILGALYVLWQVGSWVARTLHKHRLGLSDYYASYVILAVTVLALLVTRLWPVQAMIAPAWGDSVHHTMIVQLMLDHGGLFTSWAPYAPIESFTYHFGFHSAATVLAMVSGMDAPHAVIISGQLLNVLAVLALYPLASRLGGSWIAGAVAILVAGLVSQQPGMFVNWGRYTQLSAQIILPVLIWAMDVWWTEPVKPSKGLLFLIALMAAGLALTHYRVAILGALAAVAWSVWALWCMRDDVREWLSRTLQMIATGAAAGILILPWVRVIQNSRLAESTATIAERSTSSAVTASELAIWQTLNSYYATLLLVIALVALAVAFWRRRQLAAPLSFWILLVFIAANPYLLGLPGAGIVTNFLLMLALYIPVAVLIGWLSAEVWGLVGEWQSVRIGLAVAATLLAVLGIRYQLDVVDPFYEMVMQSDIAAMDWIDENTPAESRFLVNTFLAYNGRVVAGSDAGWWLPYYTQRESNLPPMLYSVERLADGVDRDSFPQLVRDIQASEGERGALRTVLCANGISHVYLGERQGEVGVGVEPLIPPAWLADNPDFSLEFQASRAQVWSFATDRCEAFH